MLFLAAGMIIGSVSFLAGPAVEETEVYLENDNSIISKLTLVKEDGVNIGENEAFQAGTVLVQGFVRGSNKRKMGNVLL